MKEYENSYERNLIDDILKYKGTFSKFNDANRKYKSKNRTNQTIIA